MTEQFITQLFELDATLQPWSKKQFHNDIAPILEIVADFKLKSASLQDESRTLRIGIMGQVKAGKSSFLNALLFNGQPILPEAATPKTANLTHISFGDSYSLTVGWYTPAEWAELSVLAASTGEHQEARVARELVGMMRNSGINIAATLEQGELTLEASDMGSLKGLLNDYTGSDGKYTPLVKATTLRLPIEDLRGFDVVDTPGMNDPVVSRTMKTRKFMAECDVVFFLSRCSQFLDESDMNLLAQQLPGKGVKRMVLVAGQFDAALLDVSMDCTSLMKAEDDIRRRLNKRATDELGKLAKRREDTGHVELAQLLRATSKPIFASSYAYGFANWPQAEWGKGMNHVFGELNDAAENDWGGQSITVKDWERIGNFTELAQAYSQARTDKEALLQAQRQQLIPETRRHLTDELQSLLDTVCERERVLQSGDLEKLTCQMQVCQQRISSIAQQLAAPINSALELAKQTHQRLITELRQALANASLLQARTGTETHHHQYEVSTSSWYNPFSWGSSETRHYTTSSSYQYLACSDAIENVVNFGNTNSVNLQREFNRVLDPQRLKRDLRSALLTELDTASTGFDPGHFRMVLDHTISHLPSPQLEITLGDVTSLISRSFSGEIRNDEQMTRLRETLQQALEAVLNQLLKAFDHGVATLHQQLGGIADQLKTQFAKDLEQEIAILKAAFADKENELREYAVLRETLERQRVALAIFK